MMVFFLKRNGKMLMTLRSVLEIVHVFIYSYIEAAEAENTGSVTVNETVRLRHSFTQRHTEHAGFIYKLSFCSLIFTHTSPYRVLI